jgi:hypothetical protein
MSCSPYTYLIGWSHTKTYYYGVRYAAHCNPSDLWVTYFTSSKHVKNYREENGEPDIIQIRKVFNSTTSARSWEEKLLKRIDASSRSDFLNKANGRAIPAELSVHRGSSNGMFGKKHTAATLIKMQGPKNNSHRLNMYGKRPHVNQKGSNNNAFKGFITTPFGRFDNLHAAAAVECVNYSTIAYRINSDSDKFKQYERSI